jgi:hypothetical protein
MDDNQRMARINHLKSTCECGSIIKNMTAHLKTKKHQRYLQRGLPPALCTRTRTTESKQMCAHDILVFFKKSTRAENDIVNKLRESILIDVINRPSLIDTFKSTSYYNQWNMVQTNFRDILTTSIPISHTCVVKKMAGRSHNYDFLIQYYNEANVTHTKKVKCEFKYGTSIFSYPQMASIYIKNNTFNMVKSGPSYIEYWYTHYLDDFISELNVTKPPFDEYLKTINSTTYKTDLQNALYTIYKSSDTRLQRRLHRIVDRSITAYLQQLTCHSLHFKDIEKLIQLQMDKLFVFCENGHFRAERLCNITTTSSTIRFSHNSIVIDVGTFVISALLRWKNYKGCAGPAWQIGIKMKPKKRE